MKNCPFDSPPTPCDPETLITVAEPYKHEKHGKAYRSYVKCGDCGATGPFAYAVDFGDARQMAVDYWDART